MLCVQVQNIKGVNTLVLDSVSVAPNCTYSLLTPAELNNLSTVSVTDFAALYQEYFGFSPSTFALIISSCLFAYASGHITGAIWKGMSKTF